MPVAIEAIALGAGDIYRDGELYAKTRENNVARILYELDAPILNGVGGKVTGTDYYIRRPYAQLEFTIAEFLGPAMADVVPAAEVDESGDDVTITPPLVRRLGTDIYHEWELRVPSVPGREAFFNIPIGINLQNPEATASDSADPLSPRLMIEGRFDHEDDDAAAWTWGVRDSGS